MSLLVLNIPAEVKLAPLARAFAQHGAQSFGFAENDAVSLGLAASDVLNALSGTPGSIEWSLRDHGSYLELSVKFPRVGVQLSHLNLARSEDEGDPSRPKHEHWLGASRAVDRFQLDLSQPGQLKFLLRKYRSFPEVEPLAGEAPLGPAVTFASPSYQELHLFCQRLLALEDPRLLPPFLSQPEQLQVMTERGQAVIELGFSAQGDPVAGLLARLETPRVARLFGPYLVPSTSPVATELLHRVVKRFSKSSIQGLFCEHPDLAFGSSEMERLGERVVHLEDGESLVLQGGYRSLVEDEGHLVWGSPAWSDYLQERYHALCLPRELKPLPPSRGEFEQAVVSCDIQTKRSEVLLRPIVPGLDTEQVLRRHVKLFRELSFQNILFALDTGVPEQMHFSEALKACDFKPCYLIPNAGKGDIVLFQVQPR